MLLCRNEGHISKQPIPPRFARPRSVWLLISGAKRARVYLHYCFDLWAQRWRRRHACGNVIFVRYVDDILAGFRTSHRCTRKASGP